VNASVRSVAKVHQRVDGEARIAFRRRADGVVALADLYQRAPCRVLFPTTEAGEPVQAVLLTTSGGLTGGDRTRVSVSVEPGARATITTQAAEKIYRALPDTGDVDPSRCHSSYVRRHDYYRTIRPRYFFFFDSPDLFPGFSDCLPSGYLPGQERGGDACLRAMHSRLSARFKKVFQNRLFSVFDLDVPLSTAQRPSSRPVSLPRA